MTELEKAEQTAHCAAYRLEKLAEVTEKRLRGGQVVRHQAHNLEYEGPIPSPAFLGSSTTATSEEVQPSPGGRANVVWRRDRQRIAAPGPGRSVEG